MLKVSFREIVIRLAPVCVMLTFAGPIAAADDLELSLKNGRVTIRAQQVSIKAILSEWGRVGNTAIIDADGLADQVVTLELVDVPEARALRTLLRDAAGYLAAPRAELSDGDSRFDRILVMAVTKPAAARQVAAVGGSRPAPPRVSPTSGRSPNNGQRGRTPFTATAAQQEQLEQLQQLLRQSDDGDDEEPEAVDLPTFGDVPASRPGLPMGSSDPSRVTVGIQTGAFGSTTTAPAAAAPTTTIRRR
jgi:hypothetical protein